MWRGKVEDTSVSQLRRSLSRYSSLRRKYPQAKSVVTYHITDRTTHNSSMLPLLQTATCIIKANRNFHSTCLNIIVLHTSILTDIKRKTFWENRNTSENRIKKRGSWPVTWKCKRTRNHCARVLFSSFRSVKRQPFYEQNANTPFFFSLSLSKTQTLGFHYSGDLTKVRLLIFFSVGFTA